MTAPGDPSLGSRRYFSSGAYEGDCLCKRENRFLAGRKKKVTFETLGSAEIEVLPRPADERRENKNGSGVEVGCKNSRASAEVNNTGVVSGCA